MRPRRASSKSAVSSNGSDEAVDWWAMPGISFRMLARGRRSRVRLQAQGNVS